MTGLPRKLRDQGVRARPLSDHSLGEYTRAGEAALLQLQGQRGAERIWRRDHTLWRPEAREIADRLGWLDLPQTMAPWVPELQAFAQEVRSAGYTQAVVLGMGGSSLGAEVLRQTFSSPPNVFTLTVLDSTVPAQVHAVTEALDLGRTLFLISSKSGTTIESLCLCQHFQRLVEQQAGPGKAGRSFVAITDPGTPLERLAQEQGFRRVFLNPSDVGARYSALSLFGLVPAALMGLDLATLLGRAEAMRRRCTPDVPLGENPGAWLGATLAALAQQGRDKLTLLTSPGIAGLALWVEQLLAESLGKDGKGIVPVAGEPGLSPQDYAQDRAFVSLEMEGDGEADAETLLRELQALGHPVVRLKLRDRYDLGAEFFRWEFASAIAGALLGVQPFDQPHVHLAQERTRRILQEYVCTGRLLAAEGGCSLQELLKEGHQGCYVAVLAYLRQTPEVDQALTDLRRQVAQRHRIATTLGYGPRYLHSTGQLHKGGPDTGLYVLATAPHEGDLPIPGEPFTFGVLADAQALGDFQALRERGRAVALVRLPSADVSPLQEMVAKVA